MNASSPVAAGRRGARRLAIVLWKGDIGGAEVLTAAIAARMRTLGAEPTLVFVMTPEPLASRLSDVDVAVHSLGFTRGRDILQHPRQYATEVARAGPDGALVAQCGLMGAVLRTGGYGGPIVAVEHGALLGLSRFSPRYRLVNHIARLGGALSVDAEVAVSDFMLKRMQRYPHAKRNIRIYNGVDPLAGYSGDSTDTGDVDHDAIVIGFAGRLIEGKGADHLIRALALVREFMPARLLVAGDGPERARLALLARELRVADGVELLGSISDMPAFWRRCHIAAIPSAAFVESFSMVTLEAMACGKAVVAARNGAIPELVVHGTTGTLVPVGDVGALARAVIAYGQNPGVRQVHGEAGRARAVERFGLDDCVNAYLDLFSELARGRSVGGCGRPGQSG